MNAVGRIQDKINIHTLLLSVKNLVIIFVTICEFTHTGAVIVISRFREGMFPVLFVICFAKFSFYEYICLELYLCGTAAPRVFDSHFRVLARYWSLLHFDIVCVCTHLNLNMS